MNFSRPNCLPLSAVLFIVVLTVLVQVRQLSAQNGVLDHFSWSQPPSSVQTGEPFAVTITARDLNHGVVSNFNGNVVTALYSVAQRPSVLLTEIELGTIKRVELSNISGSPVDLTGWKLFLYDRISWPAPKVIHTFQSNTVCPPGGVFEVRGGGSFPGTYPVFFTGVSVGWLTQLSNNNAVAVLLLDDRGSIVDFFCGTGAFPAFINVPTSISELDWSGAPAGISANGALTYQRSGAIDNNNAADWSMAANTFGVLNPALRFPFGIGSVKSSAVPSSVTLTNGIWSGLVAAASPGTNVWLRADDGSGHSGDSSLFNVRSLPSLTLQVPETASKASPGLVGMGNVAIPAMLASDLTVTLSNSLPNHFVMPGSVIIPAGSTNIFFAISNLNNGLIEGPKQANIRARAEGFATALASITNLDSSGATLSFVTPSQIFEHAGWIGTAQLRSTVAPAADVTVRISGDRPDRLQVQETVTIPAGQNVATFGIAALDNARMDGDTTVTLGATVAGWESAVGQIIVRDNESTNLVLSIPNFQFEGVGVLSNSGIVQISAPIITNLAVNLVSSFPNKLQVPASVIISAGQTSAVFHVTFPDDSMPGTNQWVRVSANAEAFGTGTRDVLVFDNDPGSFSVTTALSAGVVGEPFLVSVRVLNASGTTIENYANVVSLTADCALGSLPVSPAIVGPFTNGVWSGFVTVGAASSNVVLTVDDGLGRSSPLQIISGRSIALPLTDLVYDPGIQKLRAAVSSSASSNANSIVTIDPDTGNLSGAIPLGSNPGNIVLSSDNRLLYAAQTTGGVARIDLHLGAVVQRFAVGTGASYPKEMAIPCGETNTLVAWLSGKQGLALFRNGVRSPAIVGAPTSFDEPYNLIFHDSSTNFYTVAGNNGLWMINAHTNGLNLVRITGAAGAKYIYESGFVLNSNGEFFDALDFRRLGQFAATGLVAMNANLGHAYFLSGNTLRAFDLTTFAPLGEMLLPIASGTAAKLVSCEWSGIAFITADRLFVVHPDFLQPTTNADLSIQQFTTAATAIVGSNFTYQITVSNAGPATVTNVVFANVLPADATFISATNSIGFGELTNGIVRSPIGTLAPGTSVTTTLTIQPATPGFLINSASVLRDGVNLSNARSCVTNLAVFGPTLPAVTRLPFNSTSLAYDSLRNTLWTSVERFGGASEHGLRSINLSNGLPHSSFTIGYPVGKIAISSSQNYLYAVYVNNADQLNYTPDNFIRRANLASQTLDQDFALVDSFNQQHAAVDMIGISSFPDGVVISRSGPQQDIALYNNGSAIRRTPSDTGPGKLEVNPTAPTEFYRLLEGYGGGTVTRFNIGASAISSLNSSNAFSIPPSPANPVATDFRYAAGRLFSNIGLTADGQTLTRTQTIPATGLVAADSEAGLVFYLVKNGSEWILSAFDLNTFQPAWAYAIRGVLGQPDNLTKAGSGVLVFRTNLDELFVLNTEQMPRTLESDLALTQTVSVVSAITNAPVTFTTTVSNRGIAAATGVVLTNFLPAHALVTSVSSSGGAVTNFSNVISCTTGDLPVGAAISMQVVATLTNSGILTNVARVSQAITDPNLANNVVTNLVQFTTIPRSDLVISDFTSAHTNSSGHFIYTLSVSNAGPDIATGVRLSAAIVSGATLVSSNASQGTITYDTGVNANLGTLSNSAVATLTIELKPESGLLQLSGYTSGDQNDPNMFNNQCFHIFHESSTNSSVLATELPFPVEDLAYEDSSELLFLTTQAQRPYSNSVLRINPQNLQLIARTEIGNAINRIALSGDGQYAYVGIADTGGVARVDIPSNAIDLRFPINVPSAPFGPFVVQDMAVMPGHPQTLGVARGGYSGYRSAIALFDSGVQRPDVLDNTIQNASYYRLQFASATNLYTTAPYGFQAAKVTPTGLTNDGPLLAHAGDFVVNEGLVFFSSGKVVDPATGTLVGSFPVSGPVVADLENGTVYFLTTANHGGYYHERLTLRAFDASSRTESWSVPFDSFIGYGKRLIKLGSEGLAFVTDSGRAFVVRHRNLESSASDLSITQTAPAAVTSGAELTFTLSVFNSGPWTASGVVVSNVVPVGTTFVSASSPQGTCSFTNGVVTCAIPAITNRGSATITIKVVPEVIGTVSNFASVRSSVLDPIEANNATSLAVTVNEPPAVSVRDVIVAQGTTKTTISFALTLSRPSSTNVSVRYQTADGTAVAGADYDAASGVVNFSPGVTNFSLNLPIIAANEKVLPMTYFYLNLTGITNATAGKTQSVATIASRLYRTMTITPTNVVEGNSISTMQFRLSLSSASSVPTSVDYETRGLTATAGIDFQPKVGTLVFPPGASNAILAVPVIGDTLVESNETFAVILTHPQGAALGLNEAIGTILDDEVVHPLAIRMQLVDTNIWLQFNTIQGRAYRLERADELNPEAWIHIADGIIGNGADISVRDDFETENARFYRVLAP